MRALSLCMIVKDEAKVLARCLESVRGVVDEIVVVDTGSADDTGAIAESFGARVLHHPFADDFSAARNASLAAATTPWILVLDADEWLTNESGAALRRAVTAKDAETAAGFFLEFDNDLGGGRSHVCSIVRVFRRDPAIRFQYRIHEQVLPSIIDFARPKRLRVPILTDVIVKHDGYLPARRQSKSKDQRNARLFELQVRDTPDDPYAWYKYGDFLRVPRDGVRAPFSARHALERTAKLLERMDPAQVRLLSFPPEVAALLALEHDKDGDVERALAIAETGLSRHGPTANLVYVTARLQQKLGRFRASFESFARLRAMDGKPAAVPPEPGITGPAAFVGMAIALRAMGRNGAATRCLDHAVRVDPTHLDARIARARLALERGRVADATIDLAAARDAHPADSGVRLRLGAVLLAVGRSADAEAEFRAAIKNGLDPRLALPSIAEAQISRRDLEGAYKTLLEAPSAPEAAIGLTMLKNLAHGRDPFTGCGTEGAQITRWRRALDRARLLPAAR